MSDEDTFLTSCLNKNCEFPKKDDRQPNPSELLKNGNEEGDRVWKKRENSVKKKEWEKINRMHLRRGGRAVTLDKVPAEGQNQQILQPPPADDSAEEETERSKSMKKSPYEIVPSNRFKKSCSKVKEVEKVSDSKAKKSPLKTKAITAFGTTFRKAESEPYQFTRKKPKSSADRFGKSKRRKSKDALHEECGDERRKDQSPLEPSEKGFSTAVSLSKNKLSLMSEDGEKDKEKRKGTSEISIGKRSNSPKQTLSKIETKKQPSRGRIEDERAEIGKELSFFEKIQHNLRAYFNPKPVEVMKFDCGEKKVKEGENPDNDESIMIWKDERIEKGIKEEFMKGDQSFFMSIKSEMEIFLENICFKRNRGKREVTNGFLTGEIPAKGMGSGPKGKMSYSYGDKYPYNHNSDYRYKSLFCIKRSNECREKPRTRSFHRSKTLQKNALAPSPPTASTSISFILEPDQQVENLNSADGMVSAITQIQELHQEINPRIISTSVSCARGFATMNLPEDSLTHLPNYLPGDSARIPLKGLHLLTRTSPQALRPERIIFRMKRHKTREIYSHKSTVGISSPNPSLPNTSKSEGTFQFDFPVRYSTLEKGISILPFQDNASHSTPKHEKPFVRLINPLFVYTVTETKSIRPPYGKWLNKCPLREQKITRQSAVESGGKEELGKEKRTPMKYSDTTQKMEEESSSITLKDIIGLSRKTPRVSPENGEADLGCSAAAVEDPPRVDQAVTLGHYLEKLMEEKINYLNLDKTTKFRRAQKANFVADSFNFFNLLNKEFLTVKSSNPKIEMLRNAIVEKKEPELEEYLDMYKKVIRTSMTEPQQYLMDQAKQELERYTDMYYDLMRCICLENEGKSRGKYSSHDKNLKTDRRDSVKINYSQVFQMENNKSSILWDNYFDKTRPNRPEKSYYLDKIKENRKNHEVGTSKRCNSNEISRKWDTAIGECLNGEKIPGTETESVSELFNTQTSRESKPENGPKENVKERNPASQGKLFLTISVCDDGLVIQQVKDTPRNESEESDKTQLPSQVGEEPLPHLSRTNSDTSPSNLPPSWEKLSESLEKVDSNATLGHKSSIDEEDSVEYPMEQRIPKFKAFRKLLNNGLHYFGSFNDTDAFARRECPKVQIWEKAPEPRKSPPVPKPVEKERNKVTDDRKIETEKVSTKRNKVADQFSRTVHDEREKPLCQKSRGFCKRSTSPKKGEDFTKKRPWWHADRLVSEDTGIGTSHRLCHSRKPENGFRKRMSLSSKGTDKDGFLMRGGRISERMEARETEEEKQEEEEEEMLESISDFKTPPGSFFEWRFGMKNLKDILNPVPTKILNPGGLSEGELVCTNEEKEEQEIIKMDFSGGYDEVEDHAKKVPPTWYESSENSLKYDVDSHIETDRERLVNVSSQQDHVAQVFGHFVEKISEAWKTAACLKDLMEPEETRRPGSPDPREANYPHMIEYSERDENKRSQRSKKDEVIEPFENFLRILKTIFEDDSNEKVVREQIFILAKEFLKSSSDLKLPVTPGQSNTTVNDNRMHFAQGISQIPCKIKEMVIKELVARGINFEETKNLEPADFVAAIKKVGESLKDIYFPCKNSKFGSRGLHGVVEHQSPKSKVELKPKKIYYRPTKTCSREDQEGKALTEPNMELLTEKFRQIYEEQPRETVIYGKSVLKKNPCLDKQPSVYFDALEDVQQPGESACEMEITDSGSSPDPCSFSKNVNPYGKSLAFDKVIEFLRSDNPDSINFGVALLDKIIDKDKHSHTKNEKKASEDNDQREKKWYDLLDKLMDTCHVIEKEMSERVEKQTRTEPEDSEKRRDAEKASQHLKTYVQKMKTLIKEIKLPGNDCCSSIERIRALSNSRETNMERQLIGAPDNAPFNHNYLLKNASTFKNTFRNNGCSLDRFPDFFAKRFPENTSRGVASNLMDFAPTDKKNSHPILESNKHIVKNLRQNIEKRQQKIMALVDEVARKKEMGKETRYEEKITKKVRDLKKCYILLVKLICDPTISPPKWLKSVESGFKESTGHQDSSTMALLEDLLVRATTEPKNNHPAPVSRQIERSRSDSKAKEENNNRNTSPAGSLTLVKINYTKANIQSPMQTKKNGGREEAEEEDIVVTPRPKTV